MITFPNAKINLGLFVTEKRPDGFHNLESIFYPIQWKDALELIPAPHFEWSQTGLEIDGDPEQNLCVKAYQLLKEEHNLPPVHIHLHKNIPMGAGMGGGSADASFMLKLLNDSFELNLSVQQLQDYARKLGSDCAFFIENKPVYAFDKGDRFETLSDELPLSAYHILCVYPTVHVTTAQAYGGIVPKPASFDLRKLPELPVSEWKNHLRNDFEETIFRAHPLLSEIKLKMYEFGAHYASMSGSGSTIYGIFPDKIDHISVFSEYTSQWC